VARKDFAFPRWGLSELLPPHTALAMSGFRTGVDTQDAGFWNASDFARVFRYMQSTALPGSERMMYRGPRVGRLVHSEVVLITGVRLVFDCRQNGSNLLLCSLQELALPQHRNSIRELIAQAKIVESGGVATDHLRRKTPPAAIPNFKPTSFCAGSYSTEVLF
jgi:hypothetical protein